MLPETPRCRSVEAGRLPPATEGAAVVEAAVAAVAGGAVLGFWGGLFEDVEGVDDRRPAAGEGSMACSSQ